MVLDQSVRLARPDVPDGRWRRAGLSNLSTSRVLGWWSVHVLFFRAQYSYSMIRSQLGSVAAQHVAEVDIVHDITGKVVRRRVWIKEV